MPAFDTLTSCYPLWDTIAEFLGERAATIFASAISTRSDCLLRTTGSVGR